jgi:hypothetical protein
MNEFVVAGLLISRGEGAPRPPKSLMGTAYRPVEADVAAVAIASSATAMA